MSTTELHGRGDVDVAVVGGGIMGLAAAWALRRGGRDVAVLEQLEPGHGRGSSHGSSRIFRYAYADPGWVALAQEALPLWRALEAESGRRVLTLTGSLDTGQEHGPLRAALEARGAEYELLDPNETTRRFGVAPDGEALFQPQGGTVWAAEALAAFREGITVHERVRVLEVDDREDGVRLQTSAGPLQAQVAIVAAGAWTTPLLARAGIHVETAVTRETVAYFQMEGAATGPAVIDWNVETGRHAYALAAGPHLLKAGVHRSGVPADPDEPGRPDRAVVEETAEWVARRFPAASPDSVRAETCLYTSVEEDRFVMTRDRSIVACATCSGHGFKFAPAVGTRIAALA